MGCIYRPSFKDKDGNRRYTSIWWVKFFSNGKAIFQSTKTADYNQAKQFLKRLEGKVGNGVPIMKGQFTVRFQELADDVLNDYRPNTGARTGTSTPG